MSAALIIANFNNAPVLDQTLSSVMGHPEVTELDIDTILVDDGSTDESCKVAEAWISRGLRLIRLQENQGRSTCRNTGAHNCRADILIFIDADCLISSPYFFSSHLAAIKAGDDLSFGDLETAGGGFWSRVQHTASIRRRRDFSAGRFWAFTTANVAIRRSAFEAAGGFDEIFNRNGFEDRDLFARMLKSGARCRYTPDAKVTHYGEVNLKSVADKLLHAGQASAATFAQRHPDVYSQLSFCRFDVAQNPWLRHVDRFTFPLVRHLCRSSDSWLSQPWSPFFIRAFLARLIYALAFMHGTSIAASGARATHRVVE